MPNPIIRKRIVSATNAAIPAWTPADLPNLKIWTLSDTGVTVSGSAVTSWADQSGNGNDLTQADPSKQPALVANQLNGFPAIVFDGTTDYLKSPAFTLNQPETVFIVMKQVTWTSNDTIFDGFLGNSGRLFQTGSTPEVDMYAGSFGPNTTNFPVGAFALVTAIFNGASSKLQINSLAESSGNVGASNMGGFTLGDFGTEGSASNISVCEVIIMSSVATAEERSLVSAYVTDRYGSL